MSPPNTHDHLKGPLGLLAALAACFVLLCCDAQLSGLSGQDRAAQHDGDDERNNDDKDEQDVVWIKELTSADTILVNDDLTGSQIAELDGLGRVKSRTQLYPYGLSRHDNSHTTNVYANSPRDRSVGLDHMGSRFYAPQLGTWTSADPALLTRPERYVTSEFAAANPYAYANLRPTIAADRDGQFWHLAAGAAAGGLLGGAVEAARQYVSMGKVEDWGRVASAASGGAVAGTLTAANPAVALSSMMGVGAASGAAGGVTTRLVESGGKSAGTLTDVAIDAGVGAATAGIVKGGSSVLRKVAPAKPAAPPSSKGAVGAGPSSAANGADAAIPLLTRGPGGKMLGEAMGVLKATPAAERAGMARELVAQVEARATGGAWKATEMAASGGGRAWVGETHTMVVDGAGRVFSGPHVGGATQFGSVDGQIGVTAWTGLKVLF